MFLLISTILVFSKCVIHLLLLYKHPIFLQTKLSVVLSCSQIVLKYLSYHLCPVHVIYRVISIVLLLYIIFAITYLVLIMCHFFTY
jgi:hypothetical protein